MSKGAQTRKRILQAAFTLTYVNGFQATSIDVILKNTAVTKGSFFHHFKNKEMMGLAMIEEIMQPGMHDSMVKPLLRGENPIDEIYQMMESLLLKNPLFNVNYGCPAINLTEEMAPLSDKFKIALNRISNEWKEAIALSIKKAKHLNLIQNTHREEEVALFIISGYGGIRNLGKIYGKECYQLYLSELKQYLSRL